MRGGRLAVVTLALLAGGCWQPPETSRRSPSHEPADVACWQSLERFSWCDLPLRCGADIERASAGGAFEEEVRLLTWLTAFGPRRLAVLGTRDDLLRRARARVADDPRRRAMVDLAARLASELDDGVREPSELVTLERLGEHAFACGGWIAVGLRRADRDLAFGRRALRKALAIGEEHDDAICRGRALTGLARLEHAAGDWRRAWETLGRAQRTLERSWAPELVRWVSFYRGHFAHVEGDLGRAEPHYARARAGSAKACDIPLRALSSARLAFAAKVAGRMASAHRRAREVLAARRLDGTPLQQARALLELADTSYQLGRHREAIELTTEALPWLQENRRHDDLAETHYLRALAHNRLGERGPASEDFEAVETFGQRGKHGLRASARVWMSGWEQDDTSALALLGEAREILRAHPADERVHAFVWLHLAREQDRRGAPRRAEESLAEAEAIAATLGDAELLARIDQQRGQQRTP